MSQTYERPTQDQLHQIAKILDPDLVLPSPNSTTAYLWGKQPSGLSSGGQGLVAGIDRDGDLIVATGPAGSPIATDMHLQPQQEPFPPTIHDLVHGQRFRTNGTTRRVVATNPDTDTVVYENQGSYQLYEFNYRDFKDIVTGNNADWTLLP